MTYGMTHDLHISHVSGNLSTSSNTDLIINLIPGVFQVQTNVLVIMHLSLYINMISRSWSTHRVMQARIIKKSKRVKTNTKQIRFRICLW